MARLPDLVAHDGVTQYGRAQGRVLKFRCIPREAEAGISLIYGRVAIADAVALVLPFRAGVVRAGDAVRYSRVGRLRRAGFSVHRRPLPHFADHLEVEFDGLWDDEVCARFDGCFERPHVVEVGHA
ncbi:MAG TPA: hypothetical protein VHI71_03500 [Actinomycetota bacterium]|nr:hypothetical protein [Actinomycetota bacterium]